MQEIDDLKEIFTATHDLGVAWQNEIVKLRAENSRLIEENKNLQSELNNLSEKVERLKKDLRDEIMAELSTRNSEDFQRFVKDCLKKIRECVDGTVATETPKENHAPSENMIAEKESPAANEKAPYDE